MRKSVSLLCVILLSVAAVGCGSSGGSEADEGDDTTTTVEETSTTIEEPVEEPSDDEPTDEEPTDDDDDVSGLTREDYDAAFVAQLSEGSADDGELVVPVEVAECVGPLFVEAITFEALQDAGVTVEEASDPGFDGDDLGLTDTEGRAMVDAFATCDFDIAAYFAESLTEGLTDEQQACAVREVDRDLAEAFLVKIFSDGDSEPALEPVIEQLTTACDLPPA